jgi:hypothetical protein
MFDLLKNKRSDNIILVLLCLIQKQFTRPNKMRIVLQDAILPDEKCWNLPLVTTLFEPKSVFNILNTPLYNLVMGTSEFDIKRRMICIPLEVSIACVFKNCWTTLNGL